MDPQAGPGDSVLATQSIAFESLRLAHSDVSSRTIGSFYDVYNEFGYGLPESVYVRSLIVALRARGVPVRHEVPLPVRYRGVLVGEYRADLIVADAIIVEAKSVERLTASHEAQLLNYLKLARLRVGLLLNFGPRAQVKRLLLPDDRVLPPR